MTASHAQPLPPETHGDGTRVPAEEIARRQGVKPIESVEELDEFLADL